MWRGMVWRNLVQARPVSIATPITAKNPDVFSSGTSKSAWASNHTTPRSSALIPAAVPRALLQLTASTRGNAPSTSASLTRLARRRINSMILAISRSLSSAASISS